jgi:dienelactone hydrolase
VLAVLAGGVAVAGCAAGGGPGQAATGPAGTPQASASSSSSPPAAERLPVGTLGRYQVTADALSFTDRSRRRLGPRKLPTMVYRPVIPAAAAASGRLARGLFPLVVFAPGYMQCGSDYRFLLRQWASAGYVIAAVEFPRTNCHVADPDESDMVNQPGDMAYVIRRLLAVSSESRGPLSGLLNPGQIGVAGQSDGGDTVAALAANTCCLDHRVSAAVVLAGAEWAAMPGRYFAKATPPMLFVQGNADTCNPPTASQQLYQDDRTGRRYYLNLLGANHLPPYEGRGPGERVVARVSTAFLDRYLAGQHDATAAMRRDGDVAGTTELASGGTLPPHAGGPAGLPDGCGDLGRR